jgi:hypothetical protein
MKVRELIEALEDFDPESRVLLMTQQNWPFENSIYGITSRDEIVRDPEDDEETADPDGGPPDVFIVEGDQLAYGSKAAWRCAWVA